MHADAHMQARAHTYASTIHFVPSNLQKREVLLERHCQAFTAKLIFTLTRIRGRGLTREGVDEDGERKRNGGKKGIRNATIQEEEKTLER